MAIETYTELEVARQSDKVFLAELEPAILLPPDWTEGEDLTTYTKTDANASGGLLLDFTDATESDPSSDIDVTANVLTIDTVPRDFDGHVVFDYGAGNLGDVIHKIKVNASSLYIGGTNKGGFSCWGMANAVDDYTDIESASGDCCFVFLETVDDNNICVKIIDINAGTAVVRDTSINVADATDLFMTIERETTTLTVDLYSTEALQDADAGGDIDSLTGTVIATTFRYLYPFNTYKLSGTSDRMFATISYLRIISDAERLTVDATSVTIDGLVQSENARVARNIGTHYFRWSREPDYFIDFDFIVSSADDGASFIMLALSNSDTNIGDTNDAHYVMFERDGSDYVIRLRNIESGITHSVEQSSMSVATQYYGTLQFDEGSGVYGTFYFRFYSDSARTSQVGSDLGLTATKAFYFSYFHVVNTIPTAGSSAVSAVVSNYTFARGSWQFKYTVTDTITLASGNTTTVTKHPIRMTEDGIKLTQVDDIQSCADTSNSTYWDKQASTMYLNTIKADPNDEYYLLFFYLYFATKGIVLNGEYYKPYIPSKGVPKLSQRMSQLYWGLGTISVGNLTLINNDGFFDKIARAYIWTNKQIRLLIGGESLPYSEYELLYTGQMKDKSFSRNDFLIKISSKAFDLLRPLPINNFWTSNYSNLDPLAEGLPMPIYYGVYDQNQAPVVTCIDTAWDTNEYQFKICDTTYHSIKSITQVYINYNDGNGWQTIAHGDEDLDEATFTISSASFILGTTHVKVAFESYHESTVVIEGAPEIVEDILLNWCGYVAGELNASSFTTSKTLSYVTLNVSIENVTEATTVIEKICLSDLAFFDEDSSGHLRYRTWDPTAISGTRSLNDNDFIGVPKVDDNQELLFYKTSIKYSQQLATGKYLQQTEETIESKYKYEKSEVLTLETYLRDSSDATNLAQRLLMLLDTPSAVLKGVIGIREVLALLGDRVDITLGRAPNEDGGGYDDRPFEISSKNISFFPLTVSLEGRDLKDLTTSIGYWMATATPNWTDSTEEERQTAGFWCDENGYADPSATPDEASKNISRWW